MVLREVVLRMEPPWAPDAAGAGSAGPRDGEDAEAAARSEMEALPGMNDAAIDRGLEVLRDGLLAREEPEELARRLEGKP